MTAPPRTDPAPAPVASAGSRRPRVLLVVAAGLVAAALVRGLLLETYSVPSTSDAPTLAPGDRVLVLKTDTSPDPRRLLLTEDADGALHARDGAATAGDDVVGTLTWRFWPLDRLGTVTSGAAS